jgi:hypothetical protein
VGERERHLEVALVALAVSVLILLRLWTDVHVRGCALGWPFQ